MFRFMKTIEAQEIKAGHWGRTPIFATESAKLQRRREERTALFPDCPAGEIVQSGSGDRNAAIHSGLCQHQKRFILKSETSESGEERFGT